MVAENYYAHEITTAFASVAIGFDCGLMAFAPLVQYLLDSVGLWWTFRALAGTSLIGLLGVIFYQPLKDKSEFEPDVQSGNNTINTADTYHVKQRLLPNRAEKGWCGTLIDSILTRFSKIFKFYMKVDFILFCFAFSCYSWNANSIYMFLPLKGNNERLSNPQVSSLLVIYGCCGIAIRLLVIFIPYHNFKVTVVGTGFSFLLIGCVSPIAPVITTYPAHAVYAAVMGSTVGRWHIYHLIFVSLGPYIDGFK